MADYATLLRDHVTLTCRSVDRIFLQAYVPKLQSVGGVDRDRSGKDSDVAIVEGQGSRACGAPASYGVGPADGLCQPLLLLPVGSRLGRGVEAAIVIEVAVAEHHHLDRGRIEVEPLEVDRHPVG
jgi:hypothetical protein